MRRNLPEASLLCLTIARLFARKSEPLVLLTNNRLLAAYGDCVEVVSFGKGGLA